MFFKTGCYLAQSYFILEGDAEDWSHRWKNDLSKPVFWNLDYIQTRYLEKLHSLLTRFRTGLPNLMFSFSAAEAVPQEVGRKEWLEHGRHDAWNCWPQPLLATNSPHLDTVEIL